jgi:hypothetical protein
MFSPTNNPGVFQVWIDYEDDDGSPCGYYVTVDLPTLPLKMPWQYHKNWWHLQVLRRAYRRANNPVCSKLLKYFVFAVAGFYPVASC